ncbi:MAG: hypothetical protein JXR96_11335 [Deltaproteobacteria bacterium]|nr:hypothetical protein [Deltaproteobacteria bacterium]
MRGRRSIALLCALLPAAIALSSCREGASFQSIVESFSGERSLYSFVFYSESSSDAGMGILIHEARVEDPCLFFASLGEATDDFDPTFSVMIVKLNRATGGVFTIVPRDLGLDDYPDPRLLASVSVVGLDGFEAIYEFHAVSGSVNISETPRTIEEYNRGEIQLSGVVKPVFCEDPVALVKREVFCDVEYNCAETCYCESYSGRSFAQRDLPLEEECCSCDEQTKFRHTVQLDPTHRCSALCGASYFPSRRFCEQLE